MSDPAWSATRIVLSQASGGAGRTSVASAPGAIPSSLSTAGAGFSVSYSDSVGTFAKPVTRFPAVARRAAPRHVG